VVHETPDVIADRMAETRRSLSEKFAALEGSVRAAARDTSATVRDDFRSAVAAVEAAVESVAGHVQSALDVSGHVRANPWTTLAGSFAAGFLAGCASRQTSAPPPAARSVAATPEPQNALVDRVLAELGNSAVALIRSVSAGLQRDVPSRLTGLLDRVAEPAEPPTERPTHPIGRWNGASGEGI
jgi:ElaB/YqjD/DUF883 family membrane-anchored ribosome-binding protein